MTGPAPVVPTLCYLVCSTPRSGSNLLCESLWLTCVAGRPHEHFLTPGPDGESPADRLRRVFRQARPPTACSA